MTPSALRRPDARLGDETLLPILRLIDLETDIEAGIARTHIVRQEESRRARDARARCDHEQRLRALAMFGRGA